MFQIAATFASHRTRRERQSAQTSLETDAKVQTLRTPPATLSTTKHYADRGQGTRNSTILLVPKRVKDLFHLHCLQGRTQSHFHMFPRQEQCAAAISFEDKLFRHTSKNCQKKQGSMARSSQHAAWHNVRAASTQPTCRPVTVATIVA